MAPAPRSKASLTPCVLGVPYSDVGCGESRPGREVPAWDHVSERGAEGAEGGSGVQGPRQPRPLFAEQTWTWHFVHQIASRLCRVTGIQRPDRWGFHMGKGIPGCRDNSRGHDSSAGLVQEGRFSRAQEALPKNLDLFPRK